MKVCILNTGSNHSVYRTIALKRFCEIESYIQIGPLNHHHKALEKEGIRVTSLNYRGFSALKIARFLKEQTRAEFYICHYAYGMHLDACFYARLKNIAVIAMGSDILYDGDSKLVLLKKKFLLNNVGLIISKSEEITAVLQSWNIKSKIRLNYWGENENSFYHIPEAEAKRQLNIPDEFAIFLSPRTIARLYNIDLIAKAFVQINKVAENAFFVFAGRIADIEYYNEISDSLRRQGLENFLFTGEVEKSKLNLYYNASKIIFSFAAREGFPNTFFEVFACKRNLIAGEINTLRKFCYRYNAELNLCEFNEDLISSRALEITANVGRSLQMAKKNYNIFCDIGNLNVNSKRFTNELCESFSRRTSKISTKVILFILDILIISVKQIKIFNSNDCAL
jgi:glycosyltransferase involved in cell wall biosynthesis